MTKSKTEEITVRAISVTLTELHIKKSGEAKAGEKVRVHETSARDRVHK